MATTIQAHSLEIKSVSASPSPLQNEVTNIEGGLGDDCKVTFKCNNKLFVVSPLMHSPSDSVERSYLNGLDGPLRSSDEDLSERIFEELIDLLAGLCQPVFRQFAAIAPAPLHSRPTLWSQLYLDKLQLQLNTSDGTAVLQLQNCSQISKPSSFRYKNLKLPVFRPSEVEILDTLKSDTVFKAVVQRSTVCAKVLGYESCTKPMQREISMLQQIYEAKMDPRLRTPTSLGLISSEDDSSLVIGVLMDYIESESLQSDLHSVNIDSVPLARREVWARQITDDLERLHKAGVVWGDAKAGNIILDKEGNPWIIDFGGGCTEGWVDANVADSVTGDLQGLQHILKFLQVSKPKSKFSVLE